MKTEKGKRYIILVRDDGNLNYDSPLLIESVGEWDVVTDEEYDLLKMSSYSHRFHIIERNPSNQQGLRTPHEYIAEFRKKQEESKRNAEARQKKTEEQKLEAKRKRLEKLKKELGEV